MFTASEHLDSSDQSGTSSLPDSREYTAEVSLHLELCRHQLDTAERIHDVAE